MNNEEIIVNPTQRDSFTKYDIFDESNDIDISTSTRKPKSKYSEIFKKMKIIVLMHIKLLQQPKSRRSSLMKKTTQIIM